MATKLWYLTLADGVRCDYDEFDSFVIEALDEEEARFAAEAEGGDSSERWRDPSKTTCVPLELTGRVHVVVGSFNAG